MRTWGAQYKSAFAHLANEKVTKRWLASEFSISKHHRRAQVIVDRAAVLQQTPRGGCSPNRNIAFACSGSSERSKWFDVVARTGNRVPTYKDPAYVVQYARADVALKQPLSRRRYCTLPLSQCQRMMHCAVDNESIAVARPSRIRTDGGVSRLCGSVAACGVSLREIPCAKILHTISTNYFRLKSGGMELQP